ncbi:hypothetical protein D3C77_34300 [compost metagenome]
MSYASITAAQRAAIIRAAERVTASARYATQDYRTVNPRSDAQVVAGTYQPIDTLLSQLKAAVDVSTTTATQVTVATGQKIAVGTVTGSGTFGTFTIAGGVVTGIVLSAS